MIKTENVRINGVELNPISKICSLCGKYSNHKVIWTVNDKDVWPGKRVSDASRLSKCLRAGYSYTNGGAESVHFADYTKMKAKPYHIFIGNGGKEFLGVICASCNILYRPLLHQQENIRVSEGWGMYYRTKNDELGTYVKRLNTKMATAIKCDDCKRDARQFYIKILRKEAHHLCDAAPNRCSLT